MFNWSALKPCYRRMHNYKWCILQQAAGSADKNSLQCIIDSCPELQWSLSEKRTSFWRGKFLSSIHVMAKPIGPICNLQCEYCFYREKKESIFQGKNQFRMSDGVLQSFISKYVKSEAGRTVDFVWQGGEPTLSGLDFFKKVVAFQKSIAQEKAIRNSIQTNGTLLTDDWCRFFKKHSFLVGISIDGPGRIHDRYRRDGSGKGSFDRVIHGLKLLRKHKVDFNVLACVARDTAMNPIQVYRFFKAQGVKYIQFLPVIERMPDGLSCTEGGSCLANPAMPVAEVLPNGIAPWTVSPEGYADFLIAIFEEWVRHDVGKVFVMNFEWALGAFVGSPRLPCIHAVQCGKCLVMEHNGDIYSCDHFVYPEFKLGNIRTDELTEMVEKSRGSGFGVCKQTALPRFCKECNVLLACGGGCPKHRFVNTTYDEPRLNYLCKGYKKFFTHVKKYLAGC